MRSEGRGHRIKFLSQVVSDKTLGGWCRCGHTPTGAFHPCPSQTTPPSSGTQSRVWSQHPPSLPPPQTQGRAQVPQSHNPPRPILPIDGLTDPFGTHTNCTHPSEVLSLSPDGVGGQRAAAGTVQGWVAEKAHLGPAFLVCQGGGGWAGEPGMLVSVRVPAGEASTESSRNRAPGACLPAHLLCPHLASSYLQSQVTQPALPQPPPLQARPGLWERKQTWSQLACLWIQACHLLAGWPWASIFLFPCLSFPSIKRIE